MDSDHPPHVELGGHRVTTPRADGGDWSHWRVPIGPFDPAWTLGSTKATGGNKTTNGAMYVDPTFHQIMNWMSPAKYRGAFHWLVSNTTVKDQADHFIAEMRRYTGTKHLPAGLFVQLDWETTPNITVPTSDMAIEWADRVEQEYNRECVITYSSDWLPDSTLDTDSRAEFDEWRNVMPDAPLWFANYRTGSGPNDGWAECTKYGAAVWQWTSEYVHPSFTDGIDMNMVLDAATLDRITNQTEEDDMSASRIWNHPKYHNQWLVGPSTVHLSPQLAASYAADGVPFISEAHDQTLKCVLFQTGLTTADLVPKA